MPKERVEKEEEKEGTITSYNDFQNFAFLGDDR
jgi:hypothetical protein